LKTDIKKKGHVGREDEPKSTYSHIFITSGGSPDDGRAASFKPNRKRHKGIKTRGRKGMKHQEAEEEDQKKKK